MAKDEEAREQAEMRSLFTKSIVAGDDLAAGMILTKKDLCCKKPGTGIPAGEIEEVVGKKLAKALKKDEMLRTEDLMGQ